MGSPIGIMCTHIVIMCVLVFGFIDGTKFLKNNTTPLTHTDYLEGENYDTNKYCDRILYNCDQYIPKKREKCRGGGSCCTKSSQCGRGEGDCDDDRDCKGKLKCGAGNCNRKRYPTFKSADDCCYDPAKECGSEVACTGGGQCLKQDNKMKCICRLGFNYIGGQCIGGKNGNELQPLK